MVKIFELVLRQILDLALLCRHKLFKVLAALGMGFRLVEGHHICKIRLFTRIVAEDIGKHAHHAFGEVAFALQNLIEHRRIETRLVGDIPVAKAPVASMAFLVGIP